MFWKSGSIKHSTTFPILRFSCSTAAIVFSK